MFKKTFAASSLLALAIGSSSAWAVNDASTAINIRASIPSTTFFVMPTNPSFGTDEVMNYDMVSGNLSSIRQTYNVKNTNGAIKAYIEGGPSSLFNGTTAHNIPLTTKFNNVVLTATPVEVVTKANALPGTQAEMVITADTPIAAATGEFTAAYTVVFENAPTVPEA